MKYQAICFICCYLFNVITAYGQTGAGSSKVFSVLPGEGWWGAMVTAGENMPFGKKDYAADLNSDNGGNQSFPLLLSDKGRYLWSNQPFAFRFQHQKIIITKYQSPVAIVVAGSTLREAYLAAEKKYFPSTGIWPDSLLITAPQYNLWIELLYTPNQKDVLAYADKVLQNGLPPGVLMIDDNWTNFYGQFDFDKYKFPHPKAMVDSLHAAGFKVMLWISPFITPDSPVFRELAKKKLLLLEGEKGGASTWANTNKPLIMHWWNGYSGHLDISNPAAINWLHEKLQALQVNYGIDGFKFDAGDVNMFTLKNLVSYKKSAPVDFSKAWNEIGLGYKLNEYRASWKMGGQPLVQRLRDKFHTWEDLRQLIPHSIVQQLAGYSFTCPDMIGGGDYSSFLPGSHINQKLIVRSAACSALMPMMQFSVAPWRVLDSVHLKAVLKLVSLRQYWLPDIMNAVRSSAKSGEPAIRSLEYMFPGMQYSEVKDQFMLGEGLMIAPVLTESDSRKIIIPKGNWRYNGIDYKGPTAIDIKVALDELPVFQKIQ